MKSEKYVPVKQGPAEQEPTNKGTAKQGAVRQEPVKLDAAKLEKAKQDTGKQEAAGQARSMHPERDPKDLKTREESEVRSPDMKRLEAHSEKTPEQLSQEKIDLEGTERTQAKRGVKPDQDALIHA
jgi:hypothetical protein